MIYFSTWMYEENGSDGGLYSQVGGEATSQSKKLIYWRCVLVFFALAHHQIRNRSDVKLCLFTNASQLPNIDGVDLGQYLESIDVQINRIDYGWRPRFPSKQWYNQFYVFDILDYFEVKADIEDYFIIADSDCLAVNNLSPLFDILFRDGHLTIDVDTDPDENVNGVTRRLAASIYGAFGGLRQPLIAPYFGGEFFGISGTLLGSCLAIARDAFRINNRRAELGMVYLTEEAHLLSYVFVQLGIIESNADKYVRRIWTSWKSNNTRRSDLDLLIWHVPAEKLFGIKYLSKIFTSNAKKKHSSQLFSTHVLPRVLGVGKKRFMKLFLSYLQSGIRHVKQRIIKLKFFER